MFSKHTYWLFLHFETFNWMNNHFGLNFNRIQTTSFVFQNTHMRSDSSSGGVISLPWQSLTILFSYLFDVKYMEIQTNSFYTWLSFSKSLLWIHLLRFCHVSSKRKVKSQLLFKTKANDMQMQAITCVKYWKRKL